MTLVWQSVDGEPAAFDQNGRKVFTIEKRKIGFGLRRWSTRRDGTSDMAGVEFCKSAVEAKEYAETLHASATREAIRIESCILCANGNDLPSGEHCRACGRVNNEIWP
jgi:hypothetical protein